MEAKAIGVGMDGCRSGWLVIEFNGTQISMRKLVDLADLNLPVTQAIWIDMPIGLSTDGPEGRTCDRLARRVLSPVRHSSVFTPPCRAAVYASREAAIATNVAHTTKKLSQQSLNIVPKIRSLDTFLQGLDAPAKDRWYEAHPEVVFAYLNDKKPLIHSKKTAAGQADRLALLAPHVPELATWWEQARQRYLRKEVQPDDIIDALGLAVAAYLCQSGRGEQIGFPATAERDATGLRMQIVATAVNQ
ncbi:MAG: DUF429 domain-containing protein [Bacteroidota bacterium]